MSSLVGKSCKHPQRKHLVWMTWTLLLPIDWFSAASSLLHGLAVVVDLALHVHGTGRAGEGALLVPAGPLLRLRRHRHAVQQLQVLHREVLGEHFEAQRHEHGDEDGEGDGRVGVERDAEDDAPDAQLHRGELADGGVLHGGVCHQILVRGLAIAPLEGQEEAVVELVPREGGEAEEEEEPVEHRVGDVAEDVLEQEGDHHQPDGHALPEARHPLLVHLVPHLRFVAAVVLDNVDFGEGADVEGGLGDEPVGGGHAQHAAREDAQPHDEKVVVVRRRLLQPVVGLLGEEGGDVVVEEEEDGEDEGWHDC
mmetsp:Transcript_14615/g.31296  ORF Transcript_14615/g.31296 Transcript_14615/m.31296 type:complete len:309 (-) Transcript_14615:1094-2020(-)